MTDRAPEKFRAAKDQAWEVTGGPRAGGGAARPRPGVICEACRAAGAAAKVQAAVTAGTAGAPVSGAAWPAKAQGLSALPLLAGATFAGKIEADLDRAVAGADGDPGGSVAGDHEPRRHDDEQGQRDERAPHPRDCQPPPHRAPPTPAGRRLSMYPRIVRRRLVLPLRYARIKDAMAAGWRKLPSG